MSTTCQHCLKSWGGLKQEHCPACHETFSGTTAGDIHRVGDHAKDHGPDRRRCLSLDEMEADKRLSQKPNGVWGMSGTFDRGDKA